MKKGFDMKNDFDYTPWDLASGNEICFHCARSDSKKKMCSWFKKGEPVPGCITIGMDEYKDVHSIRILRCPQFIESEDDPCLTSEEYEKQCHNLIVNLYRMCREYRALFYAMTKRRDQLCGELKKNLKELDKLQKQLNRLKKQGVAVDPLDEIFGADEQQE